MPRRLRSPITPRWRRTDVIWMLALYSSRVRANALYGDTNAYGLSTNDHVPPSNRRMRTVASSLESKFLMFTPTLLF